MLLLKQTTSKMDKATLLQRVNEWSKPRYGVSVSPRVLDDWVSEQLVPGPERRSVPGETGSQRVWSSRSYHIILQICRMKGKKKIKFDQLRIYLWLRSEKPLTNIIKHSMEKECHRLFTEIGRPFRSSTSQVQNKSPDELFRIGLNGKKNVDWRLKSFSQIIPPELFSILINSALFFTSSSRFPTHILKAIFETFPKDKIEKILGSDINFDVIQGELLSVLNGFFDLPAECDDPIEGTCLYSLMSESVDKMHRIRDFCKIKQRFFNTIPYFANLFLNKEIFQENTIESVSYSMMHYPWNFLIFLLFMHASYRSKQFKATISRVEEFFNLENFDEIFDFLRTYHDVP